MTTIGSDFYAQPTRLDHVAETVIGFLAGAVIGVVLGGFVAMLWWQGVVPFGDRFVPSGLALGTAAAASFWCGMCGAIAAVARITR